MIAWPYVVLISWGTFFLGFLVCALAVISAKRSRGEL